MKLKHSKRLLKQLGVRSPLNDCLIDIETFLLIFFVFFSDAGLFLAGIFHVFKNNKRPCL